MGEAKQRRERARSDWPGGEAYRGKIKLQVLPPVPSLNGARLRELTGDQNIPDQASIILRVFRATVGPRTFLVGGCLGSEDRFSAVGLAVVERLHMERPNASLHIAPVEYEDIAWDIVLRHLRTFTGEVILFTFPNSDIYDAGMAELGYSKHIQQFDPEGKEITRLTEAERTQIKVTKARLLGRPTTFPFYPSDTTGHSDAPWIFRIATPAGKVIRSAVWNGRRDYAHELPEDIAQWVGGDKIAIVQVASPVGVNRRSSLDLTHRLASHFDGVIHWAKDTGTFHSILQSFIRLDLESVGPPTLPDDWQPEVTILAANEGPRGDPAAG